MLFAEELAQFPKQTEADEGPADILPPLAPIDRLGRQQVVAEVAVRQEARLDTTHGSDQDGLEAGRHGTQRLGHRQGWHEVPAGTTARDQDARAGGCYS